MNETVSRAALLALACVLAWTAWPAQAEMTFYWSMESETPDLYPAGSDATPTYYPVPIRDTTQAHGGQYALNLNGGPWRAATFDNPTNNHVWASPQEGAVVLWWMCTDGLTGGEMLWQVTGKCKQNSSLDTNDGVGLRFHGDTQLDLGYGWDGENWGGVSVRYDKYSPFLTDHWYKVTVKWNALTAPHLFLQVDEAAPVLGMVAPQPTLAPAYHQVLIGNDRNTSPMGLYIDDFQIWNDYAMTPEPGTSLLLVLGGLALVRKPRGRRWSGE